jgi:hypothetical protein
MRLGMEASSKIYHMPVNQSLIPSGRKCQIGKPRCRLLGFVTNLWLRMWTLNIDVKYRYHKLVVVIRRICLDVQCYCFVFGSSVGLNLMYEASLELGTNRFLLHPFIGLENRIILKWMLMQWTVNMCLRIGPTVGLLWSRQWNISFHKIRNFLPTLTTVSLAGTQLVGVGFEVIYEYQINIPCI